MSKPMSPISEFHMSGGLHYRAWDFTELVLKTQFLRALEEGASRYAVFRDLRFAARADLEELFDDLALHLGLQVQRVDARTMILSGAQVFVAARGGRTAEYCSCAFGIWAQTLQDAAGVRDAILQRVGEARIQEPMFSIDWHFLTAKGELESAAIEELTDDVLHDAAYPDLAEGVVQFMRAYLDANETVLVLQGPPGTGKTRLIRAILGEISRRKGGKAHALYTGDKKALESDEIFVKFITGWEDAFVVEDADHLLKPRAEGNENLHRFLAIADGVIRAQGRKIIFSTNLPNVRDLDDALVRPGRCFARIAVRELTMAEAQGLVTTLSAGDSAREARVRAALRASDAKSCTLAEVYKAVAATA